MNKKTFEEYCEDNSLKGIMIKKTSFLKCWNYLQKEIKELQSDNDTLGESYAWCNEELLRRDKKGNVSKFTKKELETELIKRYGMAQTCIWKALDESSKKIKLLIECTCDGPQGNDEMGNRCVGCQNKKRLKDE